MNTSRLLAYEKLHNIRDLGGMKGASGKRIVSGRLVRCGLLSDLSDNDRKALPLLADTVIDFRTEGERSEKPDAGLLGLKYYHIPILDSLTAGITHEKAADEYAFRRLGEDPVKARQYMCDMYHAFAESDFAASQYARFIRLLLEPHEKAVVWHCTAGKDRAGTGAAIVEELLGVSRADVIEDYLMTNEYLKDDIVFLTGFVKAQAGPENAISDEALKYLFGADRAYIEEYYNTLNIKYGSFEGFVRDGLKLSGEDIKKLRSVYLK
ncbi:MAG TPA: hypothetical protein DCL38_04875 [Lachnospiraceae bacterium]|nr:hypothetical protein [Lachnospiraceae bacterium]